MGFSHTPYVGQATVIGGIIVVAMERLKLEPEEDITGERMPVIIRWRRGARFVCWSLAWADNILIGAIDEDMAKAWVAAMKKETDAQATGVVIKSPGIVTSRAEVTFIGVDWKVSGGGGEEAQVVWAHCAKNVAKWTAQAARMATAQWVSWRQIAGVCGVLYWDNCIEGERLGKIARVVEASRRTSMEVLAGAGWDDQAQLETHQKEELCQMLFRACAEGPRRRRAWRGQQEAVFVNSDAAQETAAGTIFVGEETEVLFVRPFDDEERLRHINEKETLAVIWTWQAWRARFGTKIQVAREDVNLRGGRWLVTGIDNRTAKKAAKMGFYPGNEKLSRMLWQELQRLEDLEVEPIPVAVPGIFQVADEPSRGKGLASLEKCRACMNIMQEGWKKEEEGRRKRVRENDVIVVQT
jgi:hypothetical protein